ncbi:MAG: hypothetical protein WD025_04430, partial [Bacteriovoracaceae bacterium]
MERLIGAVLFLISFPSLAQQSCPIGENRLNSLAGLNTVIKLDDDIRAIAQLPEEKVWQAATEEMVAMANCKAEIPSQAQMLREIENFRDDQEGSSLNGFELEGEDKDLIRHFSEMINKEKSPLDDLDVTTDLSDEKYDECSDVVCLAQKTFGPER